MIHTPSFAVVIWVLLFVWATPAISSDPLDAKLGAEDRELYESAFQLIENGQPSRGFEVARGGQIRLATKIALWADLGHRNTKRDFAEIDQFLQSNQKWPGRFRLLRNAEQRLPSDWDPAKIRAWFGKRPPITGVGALAYVDALFRLGLTDEVQKEAPALWIAIDFNAREEASFLKRFAQFLSDADHQERLNRLLWDRRNAAAQRQLKRVPAGHAAVAKARISLYGNKPGVDAAIRRVPAELANSDGLLYDRAAWRQRRNRFEGVVELLSMAPGGSEYAASWWRLRKWAVWRALDRSENRLAYEISRHHGMSQGIGFAEGEWLAGWISLAFLNKPKEALDHFRSLYAGVSSPISRSRGAFWAGESLSALGNNTEARQWYARAAKFSATFYGQLAAQRNGDAADLRLADPPSVSAETEAEFMNRELVNAVRLLGQLDQPRLQQIFISRLRQDAGTEAEFLLITELANAIGRHDLAIRTAKAARRQSIEMGPLLYPVRAVPNDSPGPEKALVLALMRQESEFYPRARSPVGALGLMQLMPATARQVARGKGLPYNRNRLVSDPDYNLRLGRSYLSELLEEFDGSYILALAAYNAGPTRARRWIKAFGDPRDADVDPILWIERIPFSETRNYVQRILESLVVYRHTLATNGNPWTLRVSPASF